MAINSASGFEIGSSDAIDSRFFLTKTQMKNANENVLPDVYFCACSTDGNFYVYNKNNDVDEHTGKYRPADALSRGLPNGLATLDSTGKLVASQLPTSAREIVGYMDASVDHTLPDEADYDNGNEIIITATGYVIQSTAFTLEAGKTLTNLEVGQVTQLIALGYVFTLDGFGTVSSFATDKVTLLDGTEIALPYASDLSATSTPSTVQVPVKEGDSIMLIDGHWIHLSSTSGVESVNGKTGVVTVQEYDADNKEQLAKIGENAEGNLTYNGEEIKGGSDEFVGTKAEWEALTTEEKAKYDGKKVNITDDTDKIIDDTTPAIDKVYSSEKVEGDFAPIQDSANVSVDAKVYRADLNDVGYGYYRCTTECSNLPVALGGYVHTIIRGDGFKFQTYMTDSGLVYTRCKKVIANWEVWQELATTKKQVKFSGIKTKTIPTSTDTNFGTTITIDKTSQYLIGFTVLSNVETSANVNIYYDIKIYDITDSKRLSCFENTCLGWKHNPVTALFCESNSFVFNLTSGHTYDVRMYTNIAIDYRCELWVKEV